MPRANLLHGPIAPQLIRLALPLLLGNILTQLYNAADALIIGRYVGTDAFAAVGVAGTVMNLFLFVLSGFCTGLTVLFARLYGSGQEEAYRREVFLSLSGGLAATVSLSLLFRLLMGPLLTLIQTPADLRAFVTGYLSIILAGMPAAYLYHLSSAILRSVGDSSAALLFLAISTVTNALLDLLLVAGHGLGVRGAAAATVAAQLLAALCCFVYLCRRYPRLLCRRADMVFSAALLKETVRFGSASAMHQSSLYIGKLLVQGAVNTLGTAGIAAYTAATRLEGFLNSFGDSSGQAMSIHLSQNHGAGQRARVREGFSTGTKLTLTLVAVLSPLLFLLAPAALSLFLKESDPLSRSEGLAYLRIVALFYPLNFLGNALVGYFRGVGEVMQPVRGTAMHLTLRAALSWLLVRRLGLAAVGLATGLGWMALITWHGLHWRRVWTKLKAEETAPPETGTQPTPTPSPR